VAGLRTHAVLIYNFLFIYQKTKKQIPPLNLFKGGSIVFRRGGRINFIDPVKGGCSKAMKAFRCAFRLFVFFLRFRKQVCAVQKTKKPHPFSTGKAFITLVGVAGFEPATSWSQTRRDTGLRYTPKRFAKVSFKIAAANIFSKKVFMVFKTIHQ
jgi:hypothetical protein